MSEKITGQRIVPNQQEEKLLDIIHQIGFGEIKVIVNDGKPVRVEEIKKSIKL